MTDNAHPLSFKWTRMIPASCPEGISGHPSNRVVPEAYDYSPSSDNAAKTEYIFMEFIRSTRLSDAWLELEEPDIVSILCQLTQLESRMMSISFPADGSLYYTKDLEKVAERTAIPLSNESFCVGPDARLHMWYERRSQLDVDRGPCTPLSAFC